MAYQRIYTGRAVAPNGIPGSHSLADLATHVRGRADATAQVLIGVAYLKDAGSLWNDLVSHTGAVWQDLRGTPESPRAHRFPCNPTIGNRNIPDIPHSPALRDALIEPLAVTDFLPFHANHVDSTFERLGGADAAVAAVSFVVKQQPRGRGVDYDVFYHALVEIALRSYRAACRTAEQYFLDAVNSESVAEFLARTNDFNPKAPTDNIELVQDVASDLTRFTESIRPKALARPGFAAEVQRLALLA
jgi:hypothetical protein